jgi:SAM-dependent methyltransferase
MPDQSGRPGSEITSGHPSAHLRAAPPIGEETPPSMVGAFPAEADLPADTVHYGPDIPDEATLRLIGHVDAKRVLELGAGSGHNAVALAKQGAHVIVVDPSHRRLERVRALCDVEEVRAELHQSELAGLAFLRADTIDVVLSVFALASVADLDRLFRQVHRVLRTGGPFVFSLPHPAFTLARGGSYFERLPEPWRTDDASGEATPRTIGDIFGGLTRANFRVDTLLEPEPPAAPRSRFWLDAMSRAPATLVVRARKEGI